MFQILKEKKGKNNIILQCQQCLCNHSFRQKEDRNIPDYRKNPNAVKRNL